MSLLPITNDMRERERGFALVAMEANTTKLILTNACAALDFFISRFQAKQFWPRKFLHGSSCLIALDVLGSWAGAALCYLLLSVGKTPSEIVIFLATPSISKHVIMIHYVGCRSGMSFLCDSRQYSPQKGNCSHKKGLIAEQSSYIWNQLRRAQHMYHATFCVEFKGLCCSQDFGTSLSQVVRQASETDSVWVKICPETVRRLFLCSSLLYDQCKEIFQFPSLSPLSSWVLSLIFLLISYSSLRAFKATPKATIIFAAAAGGKGLRDDWEREQKAEASAWQRHTAASMASMASKQLSAASARLQVLSHLFLESSLELHLVTSANLGKHKRHKSSSSTICTAPDQSK